LESLPKPMEVSPDLVDVGVVAPTVPTPWQNLQTDGYQWTIADSSRNSLTLQ